MIAILAEPYRRERLLAFLDPWSDPDGAGFQSVQAQVALGSGGVSGVGLGDGVQKAFYLPEAHTDMILDGGGGTRPHSASLRCSWRSRLFGIAGYRIALRSQDLHQQALAAGLTTLVLAQAAINIGAVVGVMPVTGVPLPFVSFGAAASSSSSPALASLSTSDADPTRRRATRRGLLRVLIAAGGTGGHVMPALAVADAARARG